MVREEAKDTLGEAALSAIKKLHNLDPHSYENVMHYETVLDTISRIVSKELMDLLADKRFMDGEIFEFTKFPCFYQKQEDQRLFAKTIESKLNFEFHQKVRPEDINCDDVKVGHIINFIKEYDSPDIVSVLDRRFKFVAECLVNDVPNDSFLGYANRSRGLMESRKNSIQKFVTDLPDSAFHVLNYT
ncbi:uncharacterized protein KGF55_004396 [Candida pseudojiufengensis]|uniref:uncharacterized protein n=1 Tax=Candida pseudojiufengensis TaxID=497109 RepID=UPI002225B5C7|nr:uncharacterized protein KGF55_004396 [Candida pseudojiufengensis]KAI5960826.1 hypothetical protein KGF55_004396 [Candida pseudojiufengensis]